MTQEATPAPGPSLAGRPARGERIVAHVVIVVLLAGALWCIALRREAWPFSQYPMYSAIAPASVVVYELRGVTLDGGEVDLTQGRYWRPFHVSKIRMGLYRIREAARREVARADPSARPGLRRRAQIRVGRAAGWLGHRYEQLRREGRHDGPPIRGLRIYRAVYALESGAANRDVPEARQRLSEVAFPLDEGGGLAAPAD